MSKKIHVLVFPAGEVNSIEVHDALCAEVNIKVYGASSIERHGSYVYKNYISGLPLIYDPDFLDVFNKVLEENAIDVVFPTHDSVVLFFAQNKDKITATVLTPDLRTAEICRDKQKTYNLFHDLSFCPKLFDGPEHFPCFIKPRDSQGAKGAMLLKDASELPPDIDWEKYVVTEYLPGDELTVDCLTDKDGKLRAVLPRVRAHTMAGITVSGTALSATDEIAGIAEKINERLSFLGLWYFQIKRNADGQYRLLEISARCAGTMCLSRARGINLPLLSVYAAVGRNIEVFENPYTVTVDRTLISRYKIDYEYNTVYVDYDDTVIVDDAVCLPVIRFLYQCRNAGKRIVLLTRHAEDHADSLQESMRRFAIPENLFDEICEMRFSECKADRIVPEMAIFIDNAYAERAKVHKALHIPVFDIEGVEVLTDWRR